MSEESGSGKAMCRRKIETRGSSRRLQQQQQQQSQAAGSGSGPGPPADPGGGKEGDHPETPTETPEPRPPVHHQMATRLSTGRLKAKRDPSPTGSPPRKQAKTTEVAPANEEPPAEEKKTTRRAWTLWSMEERNAFFEALNEHGRDFEAIQAALTLKHKKRGRETAVKTKDQIRHFYYRQLHTVNKYVDLSKYEQEPGISKQSLELYGLINYGELRRKLGTAFDSKGLGKLNQLIMRGIALVKKGKKYHRVKTPVCRALKKLNHIDDGKDDNRSKIPNLVTVELQPMSNKAWSHVQMMAQNPRLRISLKSSSCLSSVFDYLARKWVPQRARLLLDCTAKRTKFDPTEEEPKEQLKMYLTSPNQPRPFILRPSNNSAKVEYNFSYFKEHIKEWSQYGAATNSPASRKGKKEEKRVHVEPVDAASHKDSSADDTKPRTETEPSGDKTPEVFNKLLPNNNESCAKDCNAVDSAGSEANSAEENYEAQREKISRLTSGFLKEDAASVKMAELFFLLGNPAKVVFEYEWVETNVVDNLLEINTELTNMLRRLVHLANAEFSEVRQRVKGPQIPGCSSPPPIKCTCGATLSGSKNSTPPNTSKRGSRSHGNSPSVNGRHGTSKNSSKNHPQKNLACSSPISSAGSSTASDEVSAETSAIASSPKSTESDGVFRVPTSIPRRALSKQTVIPNAELTTDNIIARHPESFIPKRQRRLNRNKKPLIVQRTLLPKTQVPTQQIMTLAMVPTTSSSTHHTGSFMRVVASPAFSIQPSNQQAESDCQEEASPPLEPVDTASTALAVPPQQRRRVGPRRITPTPVPKTFETEGFPPGSVLRTSQSSPLLPSTPLHNPTPSSECAVPLSVEIPAASVPDKHNMDQNVFDGIEEFLASTSGSDVPTTSVGPRHSSPTTLNSSSSSPPFIPSLLDISLPSDTSEGTEKFIDLALGNSSSSFTALLDSTQPGKSKGDKAASTIMSPNKGYRPLGAEEQWLNGEDFNLSNLLDDQSPIKKPSSTSEANAIAPIAPVPPSSSSTFSTAPITGGLINESSRDSLIIGRMDVDSALQCMLNENSLEYVSKFADLATQIGAQADPTNPQNPHMTSSGNRPALK